MKFEEICFYLRSQLDLLVVLFYPLIMSHFFELLDKKIPEGISQFVRLWMLVFIILFGLHTYKKLRQIDEKVSSAKFDGRLQQIESVFNHQMQIMEQRNEANLAQIKGLKKRIAELDKQFKNLNGLRNANVPSGDALSTADQIEWSVFNEKKMEYEDISSRFYGQFE